MKKYIVILVFFLNQGLSAQAYQPFDSTTVWNTLRSTSGTFCYPEVLYSYFVKGYLINNGYMWHKVYANISAYRDVLQFNYTHSDTCPPFISTTTTNFMGMFNNDSINKKVYFVSSSTLSPTFVPGPACLEFDFNNSVGGFMQCYNSGVGTPLLYTITAIDSILFDGKYHKRFIGASSNYQQYVPSSAYFIEGIGASCGVFYSECCTQGFSPLLCFSGVSNSKYLYESGAYPTSSIILRDTASCSYVLTTGLSSLALQNQKINFYPNPVKNILHLDFETWQSSETRLELTNTFGQVQFSQNQSNQFRKIDMTSFTPGVYFIKIYNESGQKTFKVVKE